VWRRDEGRCTFVGTHGHRCGSRVHLQFDHVTPVARGGTSTADDLRLRCRAHNQLEAERAFGRGFMEARRGRAAAARDAARAARDAARAERDAARTERGAERERIRAEREARAAALAAARAERERQRSVEAQRRAAADELVPALRRLGLGASEALAVAMRVELPPDAPLDQRVLAAIRTLGPRRASTAA